MGWTGPKSGLQLGHLISTCELGSQGSSEALPGGPGPTKTQLPLSALSGTSAAQTRRQRGPATAGRPSEGTTGDWHHQTVVLTTARWTDGWLAPRELAFPRVGLEDEPSAFLLCLHTEPAADPHSTGSGPPRQPPELTSWLENKGTEEQRHGVLKAKR